MLVIDGSQGEGGGQILRSALALSMCLGRPFRIHRIRANRARPGLQPQHLAAVRAAAAISSADVEGDEQGSQTLTFEPGPVKPGEYRFDIGTAGSTSLLFQALLPALMLAPGPTRLRLAGGTHNPLAPTFDFLRQAFLPLIDRMGPGVTYRLLMPGFAPHGGGEVEAEIRPAGRLQPLRLLERGCLQRVMASVLLCHLPAHIAERELAVIGAALDIPSTYLDWRRDDSAAGPGNAVTLRLESEHLCEVFTGLGRRGLPAERVAESVVEAARQYLDHDVAVGKHLADQLILPLALAGVGEFTTLEPTLHTYTHIEVVRQFMGIEVQLEETGPGVWRLRIARAGTLSAE
ncbi:MAG TPA: RNA 3'-terminal phosphate cyclase [Chromatiales bacterium]|nr:RNA 3'-terminal phosphate cyclase [Chromatiales bacterium]